MIPDDWLLYHLTRERRKAARQGADETGTREGEPPFTVGCPVTAKVPAPVSQLQLFPKRPVSRTMSPITSMSWSGVPGPMS